jgi:transcriptional regulator GlxA family with amidase domain
MQILDTGGPARLAAAIAAHLEANFRQPVTSQHLADAFGYSARHLTRIFRDATGVTPHARLTAIRVRHARALRCCGEKIEVVALTVGYRGRAALYRHIRA